MSANNSWLADEQRIGKLLYTNLTNKFLIFYIPALLVIGTLGGIFCLIFIFKAKMFPKMTQIWLVTICISDFMTLALDAFRLFTKIAFDVDVRDLGLFICKTHFFFSNFFFYVSAYNQALMSFQRLYFISSPLQARETMTTKRVYITWALVNGLILCPNITYLIFWHISLETGDCEPIDRWYYYVTTIVDMIGWGLIPFVSMCVSTIWIYCILIGYKNHNTTSSNFHNQCQYLADKKRSRVAGCCKMNNDQASQVTRLLISMNLFYLCTTFPLLIYTMYLNFFLKNQVGVTIAQSMHKFYYYLFRSFCYLNSSFNWVFYCLAGRMFRNKTKQILSNLFCRYCNKHRVPSSNVVITTTNKFTWQNPSNEGSSTASV